MLKIYQFVFLATLVSSTMLSNGTDETTIRQDMGSLQKSNHFFVTNETGAGGGGFLRHIWQKKRRRFDICQKKGFF